MKDGVNAFVHRPMPGAEVDRRGLSAYSVSTSMYIFMEETFMSQRGRPRTFDRDAAIVSAMHLFWEHGYESTSLSQLKAAIGEGISAPSFYAAFESKEALYKEALERYMEIYGKV